MLQREVIVRRQAIAIDSDRSAVDRLDRPAIVRGGEKTGKAEREREIHTHTQRERKREKKEAAEAPMDMTTTATTKKVSDGEREPNDKGGDDDQ